MPHPPHVLTPGALDTREFARRDAVARLAAEHLGPEGICYGTMSAYHARTPGHLTIKNANVCTREHGKVWWGDLDVTANVRELRALAQALGTTVFVIPEPFGRH